MKTWLMMVVCLLGISLPLQAAPGKPETGAQYVNMGSSFAAGPGIKSVKPGSVPRCQQSTANYASLLADSLHLTLEDRSCGGAQSIHLLEAWKELPPQIDAVNSSTRLVTITVGGNDLNYVRNLFAASCVEKEGFTYQGKTYPCFPEVAVGEEVYTQLKSNLVKIAKQITSRAPQAKIIFIQYVTLIPEKLCKAIPLTTEEAERMRHLAGRLAKITTSAARETGALVLNTDTLSAGHTACDRDPWSIGAHISTGNDEGRPWHPNRRAHELIAEHLRQMLKE